MPSSLKRASNLDATRRNAIGRTRFAISIALCLLVGSIPGCDPAGPSTTNMEPANPMRSTPVPSTNKSYGVVVTADQVNLTNLARWKAEQNSVALKIDSPTHHVPDLAAANAIQGAGLQLDYFIEVGRCPEMAAAYPQWMASLQGHPEWRRQFPDVPEPNARQVIKNSPWVPILYRESFDAHLARIETLLDRKPAAARIWLNDLQAAPSACGCGHPLCRWTADYGPIKTATPLGQNAAAEFVVATRQLATESEVIPIFVGECEREDKDSVCCGVACFDGKCWQDFAKQLDALAAVSPAIGVGCFYREFDRDLPRYAKPAGWIPFTLDSFSSMPPKRNGTGVAVGRLIAILQGWDITPEQLAGQIERVNETEAKGYLVSLCPIDQRWQPVVFDLPESIVTDDKLQ